VSYVHFIGGVTRQGKIISIHLGVSRNPEQTLASWKELVPFNLKILGLVEGTLETLEPIQQRFKSDRIHGSWYKPSDALVRYIGQLPPLDPNHKMLRVSLDLAPDEVAILERLVETRGAGTKAALLRVALNFYNLLVEHKERGYLIQAVKGGSLLQFPELDVPYPLTIRAAKGTSRRKRHK
jgi:hypothetical protein